MGLLDRAFERRSTEQILSPKDPALIELFGGRSSVAGPRVTPESALQVSGWYAGIQILAGTVASLPCFTYARSTNGRTRAADHPVYSILHDQPNPWMTPTEYFENGMSHVLCWGNHFAVIERNGAGEVTALWPLPPNTVRMEIVGNRIWYYYCPIIGGEQIFRMEDMLHIRGLARPNEYSIWGYSPVDLAREALGLAKAEEEYRSRFFRNDARPGAIVEYPGQMSDIAFQRFKDEWRETYSGLGNKYKIGFLEQGLKWHDVGFPPETTQFIEGRKFQLEEIARILRIPLVLLQSTEKATSWGTGIEQFMLGFVQFTIREWLVRWERRLNLMLFTPSERKKYYVEFLQDALLRADSSTRAQVFQIWRRNGVINADEWRQMENLNPLPGGQGKAYIIESNMVPLDQVIAGTSPTPPAKPSALPQPSSNGNGTRYLNGEAH